MKAARKIVTGLANIFAVGGLSLLLILAVFTLLDGLLRAIANTLTASPEDIKLGDAATVTAVKREP